MFLISPIFSLVGKMIRIFVFFGVLVVIVLLMSAGHVYWHYHSEATTERDCAVVFGAAVWRDDVPSHALADRTLSAGELFSDGRVSCIVLSGGDSTYGAHEVDVMKKVLLEEGIPPTSLITDYDGINTIATLEHLDIDKSYVLVSNDFHLGRIKLLAHQRGIKHFDLHASTYLHGRYPKEPYFFFREVMANIYYGLRLERNETMTKVKEVTE